jgi:predicted aspartyl protease
MGILHGTDCEDIKMEILTMGKVVVAAKIENQEDITLVERGISSPDQVRSVEVSDALVDTGATMISLPKRLIAQLGLRKIRSRTAKTTAGIVTFNIYSQIKLTVQGRECLSQVAEIPDECPVLIGQIPLELLDFVVDPVGQRLIGNPDHGGEHMIEMF